MLAKETTYSTVHTQHQQTALTRSRKISHDFDHFHSIISVEKDKVNKQWSYSDENKKDPKKMLCFLHFLFVTCLRDTNSVVVVCKSNGKLGFRNTPETAAG